MSRICVWDDVSDVYFTVSGYWLDDVLTPEGFNLGKDDMPDFFTVVDNPKDAINLAEELVKTDHYNMSAVVMTIDGEEPESEVIAQFVSATPDEINIKHHSSLEKHDMLVVSDTPITYYWKQDCNQKLTEKISKAISEHDYNTFIEMFYDNTVHEFDLPNTGKDEDGNEIDITIKENFEQITNHIYM